MGKPSGKADAAFLFEMRIVDQMVSAGTITPADRERIRVELAGPEVSGMCLLISENPCYVCPSERCM